MSWNALPPEIRTLRELQLLGNGKDAYVTLTLESGVRVEIGCSCLDLEVLGRVHVSVAPFGDRALDIRYTAPKLVIERFECSFTDRDDDPFDGEFDEAWARWTAALLEHVEGRRTARDLKDLEYVVRTRGRLRGTSR